MAQSNFERTWGLDDITIVSRSKGGDGRTVEAYAAVFDTSTEIRDQHGHYNEKIDRSAFNRTLNNNGTSKTMVLYNHGMDTYGQSGGLASVPIGKPLEIRADSRGLLTVTRYNKSDLADAVLESIKNGDITAQSFRGRIFRSDPDRIPKARTGAPLTTVTRLELGLTDYGPTPMAAYSGASIMAVRSASDIAAYIQSNTIDAEEREYLLRLLTDSNMDSGSDDSLKQEHSLRSIEKTRLRARTLFEGFEK